MTRRTTIALLALCFATGVALAAEHVHSWGSWGASYVNEQICGSGEMPPTRKRTCKDRTCACGGVVGC